MEEFDLPQMGDDEIQARIITGSLCLSTFVAQSKLGSTDTFSQGYSFPYVGGEATKVIIMLRTKPSKKVVCCLTKATVLMSGNSVPLSRSKG